MGTKKGVAAGAAGVLVVAALVAFLAHGVLKDAQAAELERAADSIGVEYRAYPSDAFVIAHAIGPSAHVAVHYAGNSTPIAATNVSADAEWAWQIERTRGFLQIYIRDAQGDGEQHVRYAWVGNAHVAVAETRAELLAAIKEMVE